MTGMPSPQPPRGPQPPGGTVSLAARSQSPCSPPPKRSGAAYDHRPAPGPARAPRRHRTVPGGKEVRVILPDQQPPLTPAAARVLLRILLGAAGRDTPTPEGKGEL
jgi:hypothetical protein